MADSDKAPVNPFAPIAAAVVAVMESLGALAKEQENKAQRYKFASIDDFIEHVRGACAAEGLFIIPSEEGEPELVQTQTKDGKPLMQWKVRHAFMLCHKSGYSYGPIYKSVMVQASGAQAAGAAQSYALKQLLRGLFLIPTYDGDDPDKQSAEISAPGSVESREKREARLLYDRIRKSKDLDDLNIKWEDSEFQRSGYTPDIQEHLQKAYDKRKAELDAE